jgi:uncharacterized protein (TIGR02646 family)
LHKLVRDPIAPAGLTNYRHGQHNWSLNSPNAIERAEIWEKLDLMQGHRCAYCEIEIKDGDRHIEHYRQKRSYPQGTFEWANLFGSCNRLDTCGKHKDTCGAYLHTQVIKPDLEDPEDFLVFSPDGSISAREKLSEIDRNRAVETIRVFGLNNTLRQIRRSQLTGYIQTAEAFAELAEIFPMDEWLPEFEKELAAIAHLPFATAIKHVLTPQA